MVPVGAGGDRSDQATGGRSRVRRCDVGCNRVVYLALKEQRGQSREAQSWE